MLLMRRGGFCAHAALLRQLSFCESVVRFFRMRYTSQLSFLSFSAFRKNTLVTQKHVLVSIAAEAARRRKLVLDTLPRRGGRGSPRYNPTVLVNALPVHGSSGTRHGKGTGKQTEHLTASCPAAQMHTGSTHSLTTPWVVRRYTSIDRDRFVANHTSSMGRLLERNDAKLIPSPTQFVAPPSLRQVASEHCRRMADSTRTSHH